MLSQAPVIQMFIYVHIGNKMFVAMVHIPQALLLAPANYSHLESSTQVIDISLT